MTSIRLRFVYTTALQSTCRISGLKRILHDLTRLSNWFASRMPEVRPRISVIKTAPPPSSIYFTSAKQHSRATKYSQTNTFSFQVAVQNTSNGTLFCLIGLRSLLCIHLDVVRVCLSNHSQTWENMQVQLQTIVRFFLDTVTHFCIQLIDPIPHNYSASCAR